MSGEAILQSRISIASCVTPRKQVVCSVIGQTPNTRSNHCPVTRDSRNSHEKVTAATHPIPPITSATLQLTIACSKNRISFVEAVAIILVNSLKAFHQVVVLFIADDAAKYIAASVTVNLDVASP